jgi:DNA-binding transcriptional LysR family regulator
MEWDAQRLGQRLKLRDLNVLLTVAHCGSMGKAATQLAVSQPAISKAISDLERTLGVRLLDRGPQGVVPTSFGRALLDRGLVAFDELLQGIRHIEYLADPTAGELRIGSSIVIASSLVTAVVDRLTHKFPRITCHLLTADPAAPYQHLEERKVDLVVARIFKPITGPHLHAEVLYYEPIVVVAGQQNAWARRRKVRLLDLMNEPWTLPSPDTPSGAVARDAFQASGVDLPRVTVISNTAPVRNALLATGRFLTMLPMSVLTFPVANTAFKRLPIDLPTTILPIGIITLRGRSVGPVTELFIDQARRFGKSFKSDPHFRGS